ncbi:MAG TPA: DUF4404 family protein [Woeseiaceae bacterium]
MPAEKLKKTIQRVHEELGKSQEVDEDLRRMLLELDRDIDRILAKEPGDTEDADTISERVEEIASRFSAEYPRLEMLLREVSDTLAKLGI